MATYRMEWSEIDHISESVDSEDLASWLRKCGEYEAAEIVERGPIGDEIYLVKDVIFCNREDIIYYALEDGYGDSSGDIEIDYDELTVSLIGNRNENRRPKTQKKAAPKTSPKKTTASRTTSKGRSCKPVASKSKSPVGSKAKKSTPAKKSTASKTRRRVA